MPARAVRQGGRTTHSCPGGPPLALKALNGPLRCGRAGAAVSAAGSAPARPPGGASIGMGRTDVSSRVSRTICSLAGAAAAAAALTTSSPSCLCGGNPAFKVFLRFLGLDAPAAWRP